eukprot:EG_transcript_24740
MSMGGGVHQPRFSPLRDKIERISLDNVPHENFWDDIEAKVPLEFQGLPPLGAFKIALGPDSLGFGNRHSSDRFWQPSGLFPTLDKYPECHPARKVLLEFVDLVPFSH